MMDFAAMPPEVNSGRMYTGPGAGPILAAAASWSALAAELNFTTSRYQAVIAELTSVWQGPSVQAMTAAVIPFLAWMTATGAQAETTAGEAMAAAGAYATAFATTVPPPVIAANRALLMMLLATNLLGQNTPAIMATEAQYVEMWAQDVSAMVGYAASSAAATGALTPFTPPSPIANPAGITAQAASTLQAGGSSGIQQILSQVMAQIPTALGNATTPGSAGSSSGLSDLLGGLLGTGSSSGSSLIPGLSGSLAQNYATLPGWFGIELGSSLIGSLFSQGLTSAAAAAPAAADGAAAAADIGGAAAADLGGAAAADLGGMAGSVGALSVPTTWGFSAAGLPPALGSLGSLSVVAPGASDLGAGIGFPFMFPPGAARAGVGGAIAGGLTGAAVARFLPRMSVVGGKPAADKHTSGESGLPAIQVPAGLPHNGDTPPGYQMVISYVPMKKAEV